MTEAEMVQLVGRHCKAAAYRVIEIPPSAPLFIYEAYFDYVAGILRRHGPAAIRGKRDAVLTLYRFLGPNESYLREGSNEVPGFLTRSVVAGTHRAIRSSEWSIARDDKLFGIAGVGVAEKNGCVRVKRTDGEFTIDIHAWRQFVARWRDDPSHRLDRFPELHSRRHALRRLAVLFRRSSPVRRDNTVKQFFRYEQGASYYTNSGWIFVVEADRLSTCYYKGRIGEHGYEVVEGDLN